MKGNNMNCTITYFEFNNTFVLNFTDADGARYKYFFSDLKALINYAHECKCKIPQTISIRRK